MTDTNITKDEWLAQRMEKWRKAYIELINSLPADYLAGMFVSLNGDASVIPMIIPRYELEEMGMDEEAYRPQISEFWNSQSTERKQEMLDETLLPEMTVEKLDTLNKMFTECADLDDTFIHDVEDEECEEDEGEDE